MDFIFDASLKARIYMQTMLDRKGTGMPPASCLNSRYMPPKLQAIENGLKVDKMVIALELHELMFHCFNEVDTSKRTVLRMPCVIV